MSPDTRRGERASLARYYADLADELEARERNLADDLPDVSPYGLAERFRGLAEDWRSGFRTVRAAPVIAVYERRLDVALSEDLRRMLAALDATVNAFDDIIDDRNLSQDRKTGLSAIVAFSNVLWAEHLPREHGEAIAEILYGYWTELSQIPVVERRLLERFRLAITTEERREIARNAYAYRARDIDAFVRIAAAAGDVDDDTLERLRADFAAFRARYLLYEDFRHIKRDLKEGHENPAILMLDLLDGEGAARAFVESLHGDFAYSPAAAGAYADLLREFERRPDDLDRVVDSSVRALAYGSLG